jgi:hypothetical protein
VLGHNPFQVLLADQAVEIFAGRGDLLRSEYSFNRMFLEQPRQAHPANFATLFSQVPAV